MRRINAGVVVTTAKRRPSRRRPHARPGDADDGRSSVRQRIRCGVSESGNDDRIGRLAHVERQRQDGAGSFVWLGLARDQPRPEPHREAVNAQPTNQVARDVDHQRSWRPTCWD